MLATGSNTSYLLIMGIHFGQHSQRVGTKDQRSGVGGEHKRDLQAEAFSVPLVHGASSRRRREWCPVVIELSRLSSPSFRIPAAVPSARRHMVPKIGNRTLAFLFQAPGCATRPAHSDSSGDGKGANNGRRREPRLLDDCAMISSAGVPQPSNHRQLDKV